MYSLLIFYDTSLSNTAEGLIIKLLYSKFLNLPLL